MNRFSLLLVLVALLFAAPLHAQEEGPDPRPLTKEELQRYLPLACPGPKQTPRGDFLCAKMEGYPFRADVDQKTSKTLELLTVSYGDFTNTAIRAAYVTYSSSVESRSSNFGGGILFVYQLGKPGEVSKWRLLKWFPGRQMNHCIAMPRDKGPQRMLCLNAWGGKGEVNTTLRVESVLNYPTNLLRAYDTRGAGSMHVECRDVPAKPLPLTISNLKRVNEKEAFAEITVGYATPDAIREACRKGGYDSVKEEKLVLRFAFKDGQLVPLNPISFSAPNYSRY
jgi:hypothetical protein